MAAPADKEQPQPMAPIADGTDVSTPPQFGGPGPTESVTGAPPGQTHLGVGRKPTRPKAE